jgi:hypothetical protein
MDNFDSLRICPVCDCRLCFESGAEALTPDVWLVVLQCPNCWYAWTRILNDTLLELLEYALDEEMRVIAEELEQLTLDNAFAEAEALVAEVERFAAALEADAIVPMDF